MLKKVFRTEIFVNFQTFQYQRYRNKKIILQYETHPECQICYQNFFRLFYSTSEESLVHKNPFVNFEEINS